MENIKLPKWACELTLADANCIYNEYISIDPTILVSVNNFVIKNFCDKNMLGVHFRGTDKSIEAPRVDWEYLVRTIDNYLKDRPDIEGLFVASDEVGFTEYITERFPELKVISHDDHVRSDGEVAIHSLNSGGDNYLKGVDALVNSLLLSRCSALIRSSSFLSAWASVFNPGIPVILLNKPHKNGLWFPETEIIKLSQDQYLPSTSSS